MNLFAPWHALNEPRELEMQLTNELSAGHVLNGIKVRALARRQDCDDVLFELLEGTARVAVVHLTYNHNISAQWPHTELCASYAQGLAERMTPDSKMFDD